MADNAIVFISYSHKDERWKEQLVTHLHALQMDTLEVWDDRRIGGGEDWLKEIRAALRRARVAVLLVTAEFLGSGFIRREEVPRILRRRRRQGLHVIPIIVKSCPWPAVKWLADLQLRPKDGKPLTRSRNTHVDTDLAAIALEIRTLLKRAKPTPAVPTPARRATVKTSPARPEHATKVTAESTPAPARKRRVSSAVKEAPQPRKRAPSPHRADSRSRKSPNSRRQAPQ